MWKVSGSCSNNESKQWNFKNYKHIDKIVFLNSMYKARLWNSQEKACPGVLFTKNTLIPF